jgi:hypothetical protein
LNVDTFLLLIYLFFPFVIYGICRIAEDMNMGCKGESHGVGVVAPELNEEDAKSFEKVQKTIEG